MERSDASATDNASLTISCGGSSNARGHSPSLKATRSLLGETRRIGGGTKICRLQLPSAEDVDEDRFLLPVAREDRGIGVARRLVRGAGRWARAAVERAVAEWADLPKTAAGG